MNTTTPTTDPSLVSPPIDDEFGLCGTILANRFEVAEPIGEGGFGIVYRAHHLGFDRPVAIKCLRIPEELSQSQRAEFLERFRLEGRLLFELSNLHAGIVRALETGTVTTQGREVPYLVLEWLEGQSLERLLNCMRRDKKRPLSLPQVIELLDPVAMGLAAVHDCGIAHCDVKPANVILTEVMGKPTAKLLDFGIAKVMREVWGAGVAKTARGPNERGILTPHYAAPEQWLAEFGATGPWSDVFSFALVCVELLTGAQPLDAREMSQIMGACLDTQRRPTPRRFGVQTPDEVEAVFIKALAVRPTDRYASAGELWQGLKNAAVGISSQSARAPFASSPDFFDDVTVYGAPLFAAKRAHGDAPAADPEILSKGTKKQKAMLARAKLWLPLTVGVCAGVGLLAWLGLREDEGTPLAPSSPPSIPAPVAARSETTASRPLSPETVVALTKQAARLSVTCIPACSRIELDGALLGTSPIVAVPIVPGAHRLVLFRGASEVYRNERAFLAGSEETLTISSLP